MSDSKTFYKVVPKYVENPKNYEEISHEEFEKINKTKIEGGAPLCEGHLETIIWHCDKGYIVQVKMVNSDDSFIITPCTHEPTFGMDSLDGSFAQDAEAYILMKRIGFCTSRLDVFKGAENIDPVEYINVRGFGEGRPANLIDAGKAARFTELYEKATDLISGLMLLHGNIDRNFNWFERRKIKKAIDLFEKCISINPQSWNSMWLMGKAYQCLGDKSQALNWFEKAFELQNNNPDVAREATLQAISLGMADKAIFYAEKAIEADPNDSGLYSNYALALIIGKRGVDALNSINKAIQMNPNDPINKNVLGLFKSIVEGKQPYPEKL